jgi:hypothetical protein
VVLVDGRLVVHPIEPLPRERGAAGAAGLGAGDEQDAVLPPSSAPQVGGVFRVVCRPKLSLACQHCRINQGFDSASSKRSAPWQPRRVTGR